MVVAASLTILILVMRESDFGEPWGAVASIAVVVIAPPFAFFDWSASRPYGDCPHSRG